MEEPTQIDLAPFLAALISEAGGITRVSYTAFMEQYQEGKAIAFDIEDDGATIVMSLVEEIPNED